MKCKLIDFPRPELRSGRDVSRAAAIARARAALAVTIIRNRVEAADTDPVEIEALLNSDQVRSGLKGNINLTETVILVRLRHTVRKARKDLARALKV